MLRASCQNSAVQPPSNVHSTGLLALLGGVLLAWASGCSTESPFTRMAAWNPAYRRQWAEDERLMGGDTYFAKMESMKSLQKRAARLAAGEAETATNQMVALVRNETNPMLRAEAVRVLGQLQTASADIGLNLAESDESQSVRMTLTEVRGQQRTRNSLQALGRMLATDKDQDVRMAAARQLRYFRDPEAYAALGTALEDNDPAVRRLVVESLQVASGQRLGGDVGAWKEFIASGNAPQRQQESPSWWANLPIPRF